MQCVITGCALVDGDRWLAGDLYKDGETYVFNGNVTEGGEPNWQPGPPFYKRQFYLRDWWERRGIWVFNIRQVEFNSAARNYMTLGSRP
jgi:hypothetical protein